MARFSKRSVTALVVIGCIAGVVALRFVFGPKAFNADSTVNRSRGNPQAPLQIVEYIDFECPACARGSLILADYFQKFPDKIRVQVKYFPLTTMHQHALRSALYAECAARQNKFWAFVDPLIRRQEQWHILINADGIFDQIAGEARLDRKQLDACLAEESTRDKIFAEKQLGQSLGIKSTPTYFINGKMIVGGQVLQQNLETFFGAKLESPQS